jgi:FixJ family two-component response regulator
MHATADTDRSVYLVAVVDDDRPVRDSLCNLLESAAYSTVRFESAESFLDFNRLDEIACLVLDIKLPGLDGFGLQECLWRFGLATPIVFVSSYGDVETRERAMRAGAVAFMRKPVDVEALLGHLQRAIAWKEAQP